MTNARSKVRTRAAVANFAIVGLLALTGPAAASGFGLREGGADWMGNAFAGDTAKAYDASTVWSNPAGMVRLNWNELDVSANLILPSGTFSGTNTIGGSVTRGSNGSNLFEPGVTSGLYGVWSFSPDVKLGIGVGSPYGQRVTNPTNFVGRYQSLVSSISDIQIAIAGSYKINEQWSVGGGRSSISSARV
jgi:long-chain fatty acid transport protein